MKLKNGSVIGMVGQVHREEVNMALGPFAINAASIMLRQSVSLGGSGWWWQRVVLGVWMLMTMVLTRSYEGNLMSLLAVRHVPQPYQTLRDVVDDPSVVMVWFKQGATMQAVMDSTSGILHEVKESEKQGRLAFLHPVEYDSILNEIIDQKKVIIDYDTIITVLRINHFSRTGRCDFYMGSESIMAHPFALISQKDSPLIPAINMRIMSMIEAGLYNYWRLDAAQNSSSCEREPTKITVSSSLSLRQCWAMVVVLTVGLNVGLVMLCLEVVLAAVLAR
ncbi:ionotropic receptor 93a-like isoform X2 [Scylla paramamosain]|uniref:ionotropic receptor 93a-like isoform X2 n=1 Tax=Scylla paramamosain TaxID=85552 RepID=UPI003083B17D